MVCIWDDQNINLKNNESTKTVSLCFLYSSILSCIVIIIIIIIIILVYFEHCYKLMH